MSLATLAMGDTQAVELAQTCHLGLGYQHKIICPENLLSLQSPPPRGSTAVGIVIDDFVSLSKVPSDFSGDVPSPAAVLADEMQEVYKSVNLVPHEKKAFRDCEESNFWGIDLDGGRGIVRGSLKRAIPLTGIILRMVKIGFATAELLQVLAGALISLLLYRRRLMALLDSLFDSYRNRLPRDIIKLEGPVKSDLLCLCCLMPVAGSNLRALVSPRITATDASGWGEAGVVSDIPQKAADELYRHTLKKNVWTRLLDPSSALLRSKGLLPCEAELPNQNETFKYNPLWEKFAKSLTFRLLFKQAAASHRHINVGEVRSVLKAEKILGLRNPCRREMYGIDSQVALGALLKGRASSPALNSLLVQSLPHMLACESYFEGMYFSSKSNPSDDPTRGAALRGASEMLPEWWDDVCNGNFEALDEWLERHGLDAHTVSGLPPFADLDPEGKLHNSGSLPESSLAEEEKNKLDEEVDTLTESLGCEVPSTLPLQPEEERKQSHSCRVKALGNGEEPPRDLNVGSKEACILDSRDHGEGPVVASERDVDPREGAVLSDEVKEVLGSFSKNQFLGLTAWPPDRPGYLDLFSGVRGVARHVSSRSQHWSLCFDLEHSPKEDLLNPELQSKLEFLIKKGAFIGVGLAPVCCGFSTAITPPIRTREAPYGIEGLNEKMAQKVSVGNQMALWSFKIVELALDLGLGVWLENPSTSKMFILPEWIRLTTRHPELKIWLVDYCRFKTPWRKRTKFWSNLCIGGYKTLCLGCEKHLVLRGRSRVHGKNWTAVAQPYPKGVSEVIGCALLNKWGEHRDFDPSSCARAGVGARIGEASNPGPPKHRTGLLEEVPLVEARTAALQSKIWNQFLCWASSRLSSEAFRSIQSQPMLLVLLGKEYGNKLYQEGRPLYVYRHFVAVLQKTHVTTRPFVGICWDMVSRWEILEPVEHRLPLPAAIFRAMVTIALSWKWFRFTAVLGLSFFGITRPGEPLRARRRDLILPRDMLDLSAKVAYLKINEPKSRRKSKGKVQHVSIYEIDFIHFLERVFTDDVGRDEPLYPGSSVSFRRRWDRILDTLKIPCSTRLLPGGLRGGGAIFAFETGTSVNSLLWRMRLKHLVTLESYLQEVVAATIVPDLPETSRRLISTSSSVYPFTLQSALQRS